jgi:hypothetical protein
MANLHGVKNFAPGLFAEILRLTHPASAAGTLSEIGLTMYEAFASLSFHSAERPKETI